MHIKNKNDTIDVFFEEQVCREYPTKNINIGGYRSISRLPPSPKRSIFFTFFRIRLKQDKYAHVRRRVRARLEREREKKKKKRRILGRESSGKTEENSSEVYRENSTKLDRADGRRERRAGCIANESDVDSGHYV